VSDWQLRFPDHTGDSDVLIGDGTPFGVVSISGLRGLPDVRSQSTPRDGADGLFVSPDRAGGRTIDVVIDVAGDATALVDSLAAAMVPRSSPVALSFWEPGHDKRTVLGRWRRFAPVIDQAYSLGYTRIAAQFVCDDPRIYGEDEAASCSLPIGGGVTFPLVMPVVFSGTTGGSVVVTNDGSTAARPTITIRGPATVPTVANRTTGQSIGLFVVLDHGDEAVIDCAARTLTVAGTPARSLMLAGSSWITLAPGTNELTFRSSDATPPAAALMTAVFADTWIA